MCFRSIYDNFSNLLLQTFRNCPAGFYQQTFIEKYIFKSVESIIHNNNTHKIFARGSQHLKHYFCALHFSNDIHFLATKKKKQ